MTLDAEHFEYLTSHHLGRLSTVGADGSPQNKPVGYRYNPELGTIDIGGFNIETSAKYRDIATHPHVALVIDDAIGEGASDMRFVEFRGRAEQVAAGLSSSGHGDGPLIRLHPRRMVTIGPGKPSFESSNLIDGVDAHESEASQRPTLGLSGTFHADAISATDQLVREFRDGLG